MTRSEASIPVGSQTLTGELVVPEGAAALVLFAHGSGSSRFSPRNRSVAEVIQATGIGTLLFDLLTVDEEQLDATSAEFRFDIGFLAQRLLAATHWARECAPGWRLGYFGASTGAAAALLAAAEGDDPVRAIVSRGGRPDLAGDALPRVRAPTLLIVGDLDIPVIEMNRRAYEDMECERQLTLIPGASHLFEEPGTLDQVARHAAAWFANHLSSISADARADVRGEHHQSLGHTRP